MIRLRCPEVRHVVMWLSVVALTACGGGGGGGGDGDGGIDGGGGTAPKPVSAEPGLDARPANASCLAPARPTGGSGLQLARVFPSLTFSQPVGMYQPPNDGTRWFVIEQQTGRVRSFPNQPNAQPADVITALNLGARIQPGYESGLLGLAFHPRWPVTPHVYVYYSVANTTPMENRVSRFTSNDGGATFDPASEQVILRLVKNQNDANHNGGHIAFGPDGYLYIGTGDGGGGGDPFQNAQNRNVLFGKMLRIDISPATGYAIPGGSNGNPFAANPQCTNGSGSAPCPEVFASGLRNPWRWSFDRSTGDLWLGDVGQGNREEINLVQRGANYGWRRREGSLCFSPGSNCGTTGANGEPLIDPVAEYGRGLGQAVTGGFVYRGSRLPALSGSYVFADYSSSRVFVLKAPLPRTAATPRTVLGVNDAVLTAAQNVTAFGEGQDGELYLAGYGGQLFGLQPTSGPTVDTIAPLLSQTGCVAASDAKQPASGLIPYAPNAPFWSDGADKQRWLAVPDGAAITPQTPGSWNLPNGSVLVKNFKLDNRLIETRLFMRHPDGVWAGYTYEWNNAQTDATRVVGGKTKAVGGQTWIYPSENDCLRCHTEVAGRTLGLETAQLNGPLTYPATGRTAHQLTTLNTLGVLSPTLMGTPATWPALVDPHGSTGTVAERARSFLHTNCAQCHQPNGPTPVSIDLRHTTALADTGLCDAVPADGTLGLSNTRLVAPGAPERSVLLARINRRDTFAMPPLGGTLVDTASVEVVRQWIQGLAGCR